MSELRNSDERWHSRRSDGNDGDGGSDGSNRDRPSPKSTLRAMPGVDHPLQRAVDGGAADAGMLAAYEVEEIVGAEVAFLLEEVPENLVALGRSFAACRTQARDVRKRSDGIWYAAIW